MKFSFLALLAYIGGSVEAINELLLPSRGVVCSEEMALAFDISFEYFQHQHSLTIIDFSNEPTASTFVCLREINLLPMYQFDSWSKVNLGARISNNGLSSYSTTRGFYLKLKLVQALLLLPVIADFNPRARLLIDLQDGTFESARMLLRAGFTDFNILDVSVVMFCSEFENGKYVRTNISQCLYNPFDGDEKERNPSFECFKITTQGNSMDKIKSFIQKRSENLHGYPLRVHMYEEKLLSRAVRNKNGAIDHYGYVNGNKLVDTAKVMNFTPVYINDVSKARGGYQLDNGTFVGSIGAIENDLADLSAMPTFIANHNTSKVLYLKPNSMRKLYFLIQRRPEVRFVIISVLSSLDDVSKIIACSLFIFFPFIFTAINRLECKIMKEKTRPLGRNLFIIIGVLLNISSKLPRLCASRIIIVSILFYILMITTIFQGSIIKNLNRNQHSGDIRTIEELVKENYKLIMDRSLAFVLKNQGGSVIADKLRAVAENPDNLVDSLGQGFEMLLFDKMMALLVPEMILLQIDEHYDSKTFENLYDYVPQTAFEFHTAQMIPKSSPFIKQLNFWSGTYKEVGLQEYHIRRALDDAKRILTFRSKHGHYPNISGKTLRICDMLSVFQVYALFVSISVCFFVCEVLYDFLTLKLHKKPLKSTQVEKKKKNVLQFVM